MANHARALLDTSVVIELDRLDPSLLPAELAAGPHAAKDALERGRRQDRLGGVEAAFTPLPFDDDAARAYGRVYAAIAAAGRKPRAARALDLLIAATAIAARVPLYTRNPQDFAGLDDLLEVVSLS